MTRSKIFDTPKHPLPDAVDPAPRILRLVAAAFSAGVPGHPDPDKFDGRLRFMASILEGAPARVAGNWPETAPRLWQRAATKERRVRQKRGLMAGMDDKEPIPQKGTPEEERLKAQYIRDGLLNPDGSLPDDPNDI